jgi:tetratricopeptide (TPR) repeat protein
MAASGADSGKAGDLLRKATLADSSGARAKYATRGLAAAGGDRTMRAMLLRQLYLSHMEAERFDKASEIARAAIELGVMADIACQDLARAYLGLGRYREAIDELRRASRLGPASRRAFHLWTLGSVSYFRGDHAGAAHAFERAARWGTTARPLYEAQLLLARRELGSVKSVTSLADARAALEEAPCGQGYGRFVLGELAHCQGDWAAAREYLDEFIQRVDEGRVALRVGLGAELERARALLASIPTATAADATLARGSG